MGTFEEPIDRTDPGARAIARVEALSARERSRRIAGAFALIAVSVAMVLAAEPATADPGATVGALLAGLLGLVLAVAVWPTRWPPAESEHHRLASIWNELRSDADASVPWERFVAWAEPDDDSVAIGLVCSLPTQRRVAGAPSPYRWQVRRRLPAEEVATCAEAMEVLREEASALEAAAEQRWRKTHAEFERRAHDERLAAIERDAEEEARTRDEALRREMAEREASERRAQADAVARALRRP